MDTQDPGPILRTHEDRTKQEQAQGRHYVGCDNRARPAASALTPSESRAPTGDVTCIPD